jgi:hypothetical protein
LSQWPPHHSTMDSKEVDILLADEVRLKHWDCTIMFDVAGLEGHHNILQYVTPNALAKDLELMMECTTNGYYKQCMMRFPEVYSGEMMWDMLKSATYKASEEQGYTLRSIQGDKSTVLTSDWLDIFTRLRLQPPLQPPLPKPSNNVFIS